MPIRHSTLSYQPNIAKINSFQNSQSFENNLKKNYTLPFASGFVLQNYLSAEEGIVDASKNHYQACYIDCSLEEERPDQWSKKRVQNLLKLIDTYKTSPLLHGNFKIPLASDVKELREASIKYIKKEIDLAAKLNAPLIVHGSVIVEPRLILKVKKEALNHYLKSLQILKQYADQLGVTLYLENLSNYKNYRPFHYIFTHEKEFHYILNSIDLPFFLDVGHANIGNGKPLELFEKFHSRIAGMSFSNNNGETDQHLGLMDGTIKYPELITAILNHQWRGLIAFETRGKNPASSIQDLINLYKEIK